MLKVPLNQLKVMLLYYQLTNYKHLIDFTPCLLRNIISILFKLMSKIFYSAQNGFQILKKYY
jgi:hypothetical protein